MPWCPKCGAEYRGGFIVCTDCNIPLVDEKPEAEEVVLYDVMEKPTRIYAASNRLEAVAIEDVLRENGIAVIDRPASFGQIQAYSGADSRFGVDLFVDEKLVSCAKELIEENKDILRTPVSISELSRLAEEQTGQSLEDNTSFRLLPLILGFIILMIILLYMTVKI